MVSSIVTIVIPALNESQSLATLIPRLHPFTVVVVDDGSVDNTSEVAREAGATVLRHEKNKGYDSALETGLKFCHDNSKSLVVTLDADGQHDPNDARRMAEELEAGINFCIGIRPKFARFSERYASNYFRRFHGITDPLCGLKGYNLNLLEKKDFSQLKSSVGTGLISAYTTRDVSVSEIEITIKPRVLGSPRFGDGLRPNFIILRALARQIVRDFHTSFL